jgi:hypothetical protein
MRNGKIKQYGEELVPSLYADYLLLSEENRGKIREAIGLGHDEGDLKQEAFKRLEISQLWALELAILSCLPPADLLRRTWIIRSKFKINMGDEVYGRYSNALAPDLSEEKLKDKCAADLPESQIADLRGDALNLMRQMQRLVYYKLLRLDSIYTVKKNIIIVMAFVVLFLVGSIGFLNFSHTQHAGHQSAPVASSAPALSEIQATPSDAGNAQPPAQELDIAHSPGFYFGILCIFMGMMGSCMSLLQRTEKATNAPTSFTDTVVDALDVSFSMSNIYIVSLALSGGVFAVIMYLLFLSDLMTVVEIFPKFNIVPMPGEDCKGIRALFFCVDLDAKIVAKMLLISFLAGFAERLVPDTLGALVEKTKQVKKA